MKTTKILLISALAIVALASCAPKETHLPRAKAGEFDIPTEKFDQMFNDIFSHGTDELHSLMVLKDGKVIYENWSTGHSAEELHILWSATKTFTATAVGFAQQDGLLNVNDKIAQYFTADELPEEDNPWMEEMTIKHLLTMSSGLKSDKFNEIIRRGDKDFNPVRETLRSGFNFEPGTRFSYNSMDTYLCSVIVSRVTGKKLADYLNEKLFTPLGIVNYHFDECQLGYSTGGWGLFLNTESLAKMGQFMLQKGEWNGKQLLYPEWFDEAMNEQIFQKKGEDLTPEEEADLRKNDDWFTGYCYQMWKCKMGDSVRLDGAWGQYVVIMRDKNAVGVMTTHGFGATLQTFWDDIYCYL